jgi:hypothetical protein
MNNMAMGEILMVIYHMKNGVKVRDILSTRRKYQKINIKRSIKNI